MKQKELVAVIGIAFFTAIVAFIISSLVFKTPSTRSTKVPLAGSISTDFPDLNHDSNYNVIFNTNAYDPSVPLNGNNTPNNQPFQGTQ